MLLTVIYYACSLNYCRIEVDKQVNIANRIVTL
jgi:hypothetical protein